MKYFYVFIVCMHTKLIDVMIMFTTLAVSKMNKPVNTYSNHLIGDKCKLRKWIDRRKKSKVECTRMMEGGVQCPHVKLMKHFS